MRNRIRWIWIGAGFVAIIALSIGAAVVLAQEPAGESDSRTTDEPQTRDTDLMSRLDALRPWRPRAHTRPERLWSFWRIAIDYDQLLADALDISVKELQQAREEARHAGLQLAVDQGYLTQEEADGIVAFYALSKAVERGEIVAEALGISVSQLMEARQDNKWLPDLLVEQGLTPAKFRENLVVAFEMAVEEAASNGDITDEQAEFLLNRKGPVMRRFFGPLPGEHRFRG